MICTFFLCSKIKLKNFAFAHMGCFYSKPKIIEDGPSIFSNDFDEFNYGFVPAGPAKDYSKILTKDITRLREKIKDLDTASSSDNKVNLSNRPSLIADCMFWKERFLELIFAHVDELYTKPDVKDDSKVSTNKKTALIVDEAAWNKVFYIYIYITIMSAHNFFQFFQGGWLWKRCTRVTKRFRAEGAFATEGNQFYACAYAFEQASASVRIEVPVIHSWSFFS